MSTIKRELRITSITACGATSQMVYVRAVGSHEAEVTIPMDCRDAKDVRVGDRYMLVLEGLPSFSAEDSEL